MFWIQANTRNWRVAILILLVLAILGPWVFDRISMPAEYDCGPINIRLEGDFCGIPMSGVWVLLVMIGWAFNMTGGLIKREIVFAQTDVSFWVGPISILVLILFILPIINILFLIRRGDSPRLQKFHLVVCGLGLIPSLLVSLSSFPKIYLALWGVWLYFGVMISILVLEGVLLKQRS